jgi:hypothetical protein
MITIDNWNSEFKRLQICYTRQADSQSVEARGINDQMEAVKQIISDRMAKGEKSSLLKK